MCDAQLNGRVSLSWDSSFNSLHPISSSPASLQVFLSPAFAPDLGVPSLPSGATTCLPAFAPLLCFLLLSPVLPAGCSNPGQPWAKLLFNQKKKESEYEKENKTQTQKKADRLSTAIWGLGGSPGRQQRKIKGCAPFSKSPAALCSPAMGGGRGEHGCPPSPIAVLGALARLQGGDLKGQAKAGAPAQHRAVWSLEIWVIFYFK